MDLSGLEHHLSVEPSAEDFDSWVWDFCYWGPRVQASASCAAAQLAAEVWAAYQADDARDWHSRASTSVVASVLTSFPQGDLTEAFRLLEMASDRLGREISAMSLFVYEASGSVEACNLRDRTLAAAYAVHSAAKVILWTPAAAPADGDIAEHEAQAAAGPALDTVTACRRAAFAVGGPDAHTRVARHIREALRRIL